VVDEAAFEQPQLPLDDDRTVADDPRDTHVYPDPPWRDAAAPSKPTDA
jgi:hypothetical protein